MPTTTLSRDGRTTIRYVSFPSAAGDTLAATLELPAGEPRGWAIMAHCFTCTSNTTATARISAELADRGYGVLRFDFTGLGRSGGDFASTTFTSSVEDLIAAAGWLQATWGEVGLLVGHSLGGAAVIAAAGSIPSVRAVVTVGAPACPDHVRRLFSLPDTVSDGDRVTVDIGGRPFVIGQAFLDDIAEQPQRERLSAMNAALLVLHSPTDEIVGIDNARDIFDAARHPKSFVALDGADHLLTRREDAQFAADVISAWSRRYLPDPTIGPEQAACEADQDGDVVVAEVTADAMAHLACAGRHTWDIDEPTGVGGGDLGPNPYELLLSALGACTSMTMRLYADRKGWDVGTTSVSLRHSRVHAQDCLDCETSTPMVDRIERVIHLDRALSAEQRQSLLAIADKCPVHRTLTSTVQVVTTAP